MVSLYALITHTHTHMHTNTHTHTHTHTSCIVQCCIFHCVFIGAGKTTTFSMLTGDTSPTSGTAIISGYDIRTDLRKVHVYTYCFAPLIRTRDGMYV